MRLIPKLQSESLGSVRFLVVILFSFSHGFSLKISPKPCSNALGEDGTCMFVWECIKTEGKHLGTCVDGFLFGSCCGHNETVNSIDLSTPNKQSSYPSSPFVEAITSSSHTVYSVKSTTSTTTTTTAKPYIKPADTTVTNNHQPVKNTTAPVWIPPKPWPSGPVSVNGGQVWPYQTSTIPSVGIHTFRPSIFSSYATVRPHPSVTMFVRPTFRPPTRPASIFQHFFNTRPSPPMTTTVATTIITTSTTTTTTTTTSTTPKPKPSYNPYPSGSAAISQSVNKKPAPKGHCGVPPLYPQSKVVGGKNAAFGSWPWQASVRRTSFFGFSSTHRCGGAIIGSQWIATAGHCVDDLLLSQIRIRVGEYDFASVLEPYPYVERGAKKKVVHPNYNFFTYENDLALVQLDEPIDFQPHIAPICLPPDNVNLEGRNATVTGWGRLSEGGILPSVLQEVKVPLLSNEKCKSMFLTAGRHEYIPEIFMCAGYAEGGRDSCQGDSGGPLQVQGDDGKWFLAGIISWGIGCAEPNLPGVCTRISKFKNWILNTIT